MPRVRPRASWPSGSLLRIPHRSRLLQGNPWDDPVERELAVYLPPEYEDGGAPYGTLWDLAAFTNAGPGHLNWRNQGETLVQRLDRLIHEGSLPPVVVAIPDCYTSLGGNQYVNSPAVGPYADYLAEELLPLLEARVNVVDRAGGRGLFGKSSGAYGGLALAMRQPGVWGAVAAHAPDCAFELVYAPGFPETCLVLAEHGGDPLQFLRAFWNRRQVSGREFAALMTVAMAASYDPDPEAPERIRLPFDLHTCRLDPERWEAWLAHDPLRMVERHGGALQSLRCLYLDVGVRDQYNIQFGVRALARRLETLGIRHHFEEFDGTHSKLDWRLDTSLPLLAASLEGRRPPEPAPGAES